MAENGGRRRRGSGGGLYVTAIIVLILFAVIMGVSVFFRISEVRVIGADVYSDDEIISASGIELDDSIIFLSESSAAVKIREALAYVDEVRITPHLPDLVVIEISESSPIAAVLSGGTWWLIDKNAKILESTDAQTAQKCIKLEGIDPIMPEVGKTLALGESGSVKLQYLKNVLAGLTASDAIGRVTWLDMTNISAIHFDYMDRFTVNFGDGEYVEDKLWMLTEVVADRSEDETGSIDISERNEGRFIKD